VIRQELTRRLRACCRRAAFLVRAHWHVVALADALHELEDEANIYLWHNRGDERARHVVRQAQAALRRSGRGVKGLE